MDLPYHGNSSPVTHSSCVLVSILSHHTSAAVTSATALDEINVTCPSRPDGV